MNYKELQVICKRKAPLRDIVLDDIEILQVEGDYTYIKTFECEVFFPTKQLEIQKREDLNETIRKAFESVIHNH